MLQAILPYEVQFIDVDQYQSASAYENTFTALPDNGKLTVKVRNMSSAGKVILNVYRGTEKFGYMDFKAGSKGIRTFVMNDGSEVTGVGRFTLRRVTVML
ncbi:hypothetical protein [Paenibacillus sp. NPDC093718]|uniref:hypothetical protein n=1 Tax=Paenibacillus sp. NPDC093718 TaxID=3390601 RepID=UPI003CFF36E9